MRIPTTGINELPPPPYTAQTDSPPRSPTATGQIDSPVAAAFPNGTSIRGGYLRHSSVASNDNTFSSATTYFDERPCMIQTPPDVLEVNLVFPPDVARESIEFPKPADRYLARDVTADDWCTFVNFLLPPNLHGHNDCQNSHQDEKNEVSLADHDVDERFERIKDVTSVWNEGFFGPRGIRIHSEVPSKEAPAYRSTSDLSTAHGIPISSKSSRSAAPSFFSRQAQAQHQHRSDRQKPFLRRRSSSMSSSSSSSSSSSESSVDSVSSHDLEGANLTQVRATLASLRTNRNLKADLKTAVRQLFTDIKAQRRAVPRYERKQLSRALKADLHAQKRVIKQEVKAIAKEYKATRKSERKTRKAERKCRRQERRALRSEARAAKKRNPHDRDPISSPTVFGTVPESDLEATRSVAQLERDLAAREKAMEERESELRFREMMLEEREREREAGTEKKEGLVKN